MESLVPDLSKITKAEKIGFYTCVAILH
jgi:hypothetical protein